MTILVTGATGFIGNHVLNVLDNLPHAIMIGSKSITDHTQYPVVYLDINNPNTYHNLLKCQKINRVIHLAWGGLPNYLSEHHLLNELPNQFKFLKWLVDHQIQDITITGTCFEYGMQEGELSENSSCEPVTYYGLAKNALRQALQILQKKQSFKLKWLRLFYVYGPGQAENSLLSQLKRAIEKGDSVFNMSPGDQQRDFIPVEEVARKIVKIALSDESDGIFNICSGAPISVLDFVRDYLNRQQADIKFNLGYYDYPSFEPMAFWGRTEFKESYDKI